MNSADLIDLGDDQLSALDPLVLNLAVARGVPSLAGTEVRRYTRLVDGWVADLRSRLPRDEEEFRQSPHDWDGDIDLFRLGVLCHHLDVVLGIRYRDDQRDDRPISYSDPNDLFLTGLLDTRRGTCANMAVLYVAMSWRMGWPVSLAMAWWHCLCRFDDGAKRFNIEATNTGNGGFSAPPDSFYTDDPKHKIPPEHVRSGSDLTFLRPRQMLGVFFGLRGRHWYDLEVANLARRDYGIAARLFPQSRLFPAQIDLTNTMEAMYGSRPDRHGVDPIATGNPHLYPKQTAGWWDWSDCIRQSQEQGEYGLD